MGRPVYGGLGLLEDPGVAEDTPGNHNPVCPGVAEDTRGILAGEDVSVGDDGDGQGPVSPSESSPSWRCRHTSAPWSARGG